MKAHRPKPTISIILNLWYSGKDTFEIAQQLHCAEQDVYNELARLSGPTEPARAIRGRRA